MSHWVIAGSENPSYNQSKMDFLGRKEFFHAHYYKCPAHA
jgi:hypothetical protein